jgi:hypothetical protein
LDGRVRVYEKKNQEKEKKIEKIKEKKKKKKKEKKRKNIRTTIPFHSMFMFLLFFIY